MLVTVITVTLARPWMHFLLGFTECSRFHKFRFLQYLFLHCSLECSLWEKNFGTFSLSSHKLHHSAYLTSASAITFFILWPIHALVFQLGYYYEQKFGIFFIRKTNIPTPIILLRSIDEVRNRTASRTKHLVSEYLRKEDKTVNQVFHKMKC